MDIFITIQIRAKKGMGGDLVSVFEQFTPVARKEPGNLGIQLLQSQDDPDELMLYQSWESRAHQEAYLVRFEDRGNLEILGPFLDGEPTIGYYTDTKA